METYQDYLKHHGIPGMHWGERNGPPYPLRPMQYTKEELREKKKSASGYNNELRKAQGFKYRNAEITKIRKEKQYDKRAKRIENSDKSEDEKKQMLSDLEERRKNDSRYQNAVSAVESGNKKVLDILARANEEGGLSLKQVQKYAASAGSDAAVIAAQFLGGLYASVPIAVVMDAVDKVRISNGKDPLFSDELTDKYRVKVSKDYKNTVKSNKKKPDSEAEVRDKEKESNLRALEEIKKDSTSRPNTSWYDKSGHLTETGKQGKINQAKEKDLWNIDFLEAVQNYDLPKNVMLKEYERFLNTGESYSDYATDDMYERLKKYAE